LLSRKVSKIEEDSGDFGTKIILMLSVFILLVTYAEALMVLVFWLIISLVALLILKRKYIVFDRKIKEVSHFFWKKSFSILGADACANQPYFNII
jgi:hypothetical protein